MTKPVRIDAEGTEDTISDRKAVVNDTPGEQLHECPGCGSRGWSWQCGKACSECGTLEAARKGMQSATDSDSASRANFPVVTILEPIIGIKGPGGPTEPQMDWSSDHAERRGQWYRPIPPGASITSGDRFIPDEPAGTDSHEPA